jgi:predicted Fe-Mo cluster-binding NifX family protein
MNVAISVWEHHVSTVFDFCNCLLVADVTFGQIKDQKIFSLAHDSVAGKPARLKELGVGVLLCGAISQPLYRMIEASGITIIPFLRGTADEILEAYLSGRLLDKRFMLPGCYANRWYNRGKGMRHRCRPRGRGKRKTGW